MQYFRPEKKLGKAIVKAFPQVAIFAAIAKTKTEAGNHCITVTFPKSSRKSQSAMPQGAS